MATVSSAQSASTVPIYRPLGAGVLCVRWGVYEIASALSKSDIVEFFKLPPCNVIDGYLMGDDIDTGTEALEIDVGYSGATAALLNSGVITGDVVAGHVVTGFRAHFDGVVGGPVAITDDTMIIGTITAAANAGGTGTLYCQAHYVE